ncbi:MAG: prepilin-type N-terminal cleavage/methylation domain-containing protein [Comamonas sp.]|nr:prepilin-type N-terminal cleavage/methylation domain-containing protein [Comamonas sp.]
MTTHKRRAPSKPSGLSLVELLVAMAIGLFLIAGVGTVFVSNQTSTKTKRELDHIQENFRFGANTLQRVLRQASAIDDDSSNATTLIVTLPEGAHNCLGATVEGTDGETNEFALESSNLVCKIDDGGSTVLFSGLSGLSFAYWKGNSTGNVAASSPAHATSVQVTLTMPGLQVPGVADAPAQTIRFFAALRAKLVTDFGTPSGGGTPGTPSAGAPAL